MTIATRPGRPILRYHGGKWRLAPWIIRHFPEHRTYTEVYGGAASVLLQKPRSYAEVYNDLSGDVVNVFRVLRDPESATRLENSLRLTPFSREEFEATAATELSSISDAVERARRTIFRSMAGFASAATNAAYGTGFRATNARAHTTPAHDWSHYPDHVRSFTDRLSGVVIESAPALEILTREDRPDSLHYVDPPYVHGERVMRTRVTAYEHEMTDQDHIDLSRVLHELNGMVVISGYRCQLYDDLFGDWVRSDQGSYSDGRNTRTESLWLNPKAAVRGQIRFDFAGPGGRVTKDTTKS